MNGWDIPGYSVVNTPLFNCRGQGSIAGLGTKISQAIWYGQKKKKLMN